MKVLVACEESQAVTIEFRKLGIEAYSCDILPCSGGHPEWHLQQDLKEILQQEWDMMIAFPPCTHLALSGSMHFEKKRNDGRQRDAIYFFMMCLNADIPMIAVENPMGIISGGDYVKQYYPDLATKYGLPIKYSQVIQPYFFGDGFEKTTCLWLKNLPKLFHAKTTDLFNDRITHCEPEDRHYWTNGKTGKIKSQPKWYYEALQKAKTNAERSCISSKTFPGIAKAMATQWSEYILKLNNQNAL